MGGGSLIDFGALSSQLFSSFWWLLPLFALAALLKSAWFKGFIGESLVNLSARLFLDKNDYHLIKNVTIPTEDGSACQKREASSFAETGSTSMIFNAWRLADEMRETSPDPSHLTPHTRDPSHSNPRFFQPII